MGRADSPGSGGAPLWLRGTLWSILAAAAVYTVVRAFVIKVDLYDGYVYLYNATRLGGLPLNGTLDDSRPWLLSVLHAPVVALARRFGPANPWLLTGPHLLSAALSLGAVAALVLLLREVFASRWLALLGGVLFVAGRCYVHYCANVLTDLSVTGLCVLSLWLHLRAVRTRRPRWFVLAGVAFGAAISMKFTAPTFAITIAAVELGALVTFEPEAGRRFGRPRLRFDRRRWLLVGAEAAATVATVVAVDVLVFLRLYGREAWHKFQAAWVLAQTLRHTRYPGEFWYDNLPLAVKTMSAGLLILSACGVVVALARPRRDDLPFAACVVGVGGSMLFAIGHSEARYLLPVVPGLIYFALRAAEAAASFVRAAPASRARRGLSLVPAVVVGLLVVGTVRNGAAQAVEDRDPFFSRDFQGRAARALAAARRPGGPAFVMGFWHTLSAKEPGPGPQDEFWNTYHSSPFVIEYLLGERTHLLAQHAGKYDAALDLLARTTDGDALLRFNDVFFMTAGFPTGPRDQALEVWSVHRRELVPSGAAGHFGPAPDGPPGPPGGGDLRVEDGRVSFVERVPGGPWIMFSRTGNGPWTYFGISPPTPGQPVLLPPTSTSVDRIALLRIDISRFD